MTRDDVTTKRAELAAARRRFPVGDQVTGRIASILRLDRQRSIGIVVDLGRPPRGFIDAEHLPPVVDSWPVVGMSTTFEVLQHRFGQVRLLPVDPAFRGPARSYQARSDEEWLSVTREFPVGATVPARVTSVSTAEYTVRFAETWAILEWDGEPPAVGVSMDFTVARHLELTRSLALEPLR